MPSALQTGLTRLATTGKPKTVHHVSTVEVLTDHESAMRRALLVRKGRLPTRLRRYWTAATRRANGSPKS